MGEIIQPGAHIVADGRVFRDSYEVLRVVKVGKVMWEVERLRKNGEYDRPTRCKVGRYLLYNGDAPVQIAIAVDAARDDLWRKEKELRAQYHAGIAALLAHPSRGRRNDR